MESCLLTIIDALRTNVLVCFMMILNNIVEADSFLNIALFIRLTFYMKKKGSQLKFTTIFIVCCTGWYPIFLRNANIRPDPARFWNF